MRQNLHTAPKLPKALLDQLQGPGASKRRHDAHHRKDKRKAERQQKKASKSSRPAVRGGVRVEQKVEFEEEDGLMRTTPSKKGNSPREQVKAPKSILKTNRPTTPVSSSESEGEVTVRPPKVSRAVRDRLAIDDAEIAALEKKLGVKSKGGSKAAKENGLDDLLDGLNGDGDDEEAHGVKRKRPEEVDWLRDKRRKASGVLEDTSDESEASQDETFGAGGADEDVENPFSEDEDDGEDFIGINSADDVRDGGRPAPPRVRENPYVAPVTTTGASTAKYIPPSLRAPAASDAEALKRLRRQCQGLLNRLSEANMLSILQSVEQLYDNNARQYVTSTLIDLLLALVCDRASLNDTFLILHAGFAAALYKIIGVDFGAQLVERMVEAFDKFQSAKDNEGKEGNSLIGFLSDLYTFQVIGSTIIFDFIRTFTQELSERNTELLLKIIRTSGPQLRQDDPSSLKDIVILVQKALARVGEGKVSVRTKFMIETINNVKNKRVKTGAAASAVTSEHTVRMRKTLGSLNARPAKATEPLRISLTDIRDTGKKGKWWLVCASYHDPVKPANGDSERQHRTRGREDLADTGNADDDPSASLQQLAKSQGMNTDIRRAIFITLLSATDYKDAHLRLLKLHLTAKQALEMPRVLLHCARAELVYNPYYTLIAAKLCGEKKLAKAFGFALLDVLTRMGDGAGDVDDADGARGGEEGEGVKQVVNLARVYGTLIADGALGIPVLKTLDFAYLQERTATFAEVALTTVLQHLYKQHATDYSARVRAVFAGAQAAPEMVQGLRYFVRGRVARAEIVSGRVERDVVRKGCRVASAALTEAAVSGGAEPNGG